MQNSSKRLYDKWFDRGLLHLCDGNSINYSARYFVEEMQMQGFNMVRCFQGAKTLSLPMQMLGADLQAHKVIYNNNPILKWCLTNTGIYKLKEMDADHVTAWSNGGATDISNCTMLCATHNRTKGNK